MDSVCFSSRFHVPPLAPSSLGLRGIRYQRGNNTNGFDQLIAIALGASLVRLVTVFLDIKTQQRIAKMLPSIEVLPAAALDERGGKYRSVTGARSVCFW